MKIFGVIIEGYVLLGIAGMLAFVLFVRGCSDYHAGNNELESQSELKKIEAGLEQCVKSTNNSNIIWVKDCQAYLKTIESL